MDDESIVRKENSYLLSKINILKLRSYSKSLEFFIDVLHRYVTRLYFNVHHTNRLFWHNNTERFRLMWFNLMRFVFVYYLWKFFLELIFHSVVFKCCAQMSRLTRHFLQTVFDTYEFLESVVVCDIKGRLRHPFVARSFKLARSIGEKAQYYCTSSSFRFLCRTWIESHRKCDPILAECGIRRLSKHNIPRKHDRLRYLNCPHTMDLRGLSCRLFLLFTQLSSNKDHFHEKCHSRR